MELTRNLAVRFCFGVMLRNMFAVALVVGGALAQDSAAPRASTPPLNATSAASSATSVSFPVDLKPDAAGAVPPEQIRELLRCAEEKDIENDRRLRDYTYIEREE